MAGPASTLLPRPLKSRVVPWIVLAVSLAVTIVVSLSARLEMKRQDAARYERLRERVLSAIEGRFYAAEQAIHGGRALVQSTGDLSGAQWARYVDSVWPFFERGVIALGYVQRVPPDQIAAVEERIRSSGRPEFTAERTGSKSDAMLITQVEPREQNAAALGKDLGVVAEQRRAAEQAMRSGATTITRKVSILEGSQRVPGCLLFLPV